MTEYDTLTDLITALVAFWLHPMTMLLANGVEPGNVAAITFTELAASELATRVHRFIDELLAGYVPEAMIPALPDGLDDARRAAPVDGTARNARRRSGRT